MKIRCARTAAREVASDGRRRRRGLTLAEASATIALVAIIAAMAAPRFGGSIDRQRADGAAQRVIGELAAAQQRARLTGATVNVEFDTTAHRVVFPDLDDPDHPKQKYSVSLAGEPYLATIPSASVKGGKTFAFNGFGDPDGGGTVTIQVGSEQRTIAINADTGRATLP